MAHRFLLFCLRFAGLLAFGAAIGLALWVVASLPLDYGSVR